MHPLVFHPAVEWCSNNFSSAVVLRETVRESDTAGRFGGEEFVVILREGSDPQAFLERLREVWQRSRPEPITFSAGIARVGTEPSVALRAADRAMYRAKETGRDWWTWSGGIDVDEEVSSHPGSLAGPPHRAFVAFSELREKEGGRDRVETGFIDGLDAIDDWPGFRHLEVWEHVGSPTGYAMVSWWDSDPAFDDYLRSGDGRRAPRRIPHDEHGAGDLEVRRFRVIPEWPPRD